MSLLAFMNDQAENITLSFERVLFFSDAVFAIVITLLVLEIRVPHLEGELATESGIRGALIGLLPKILRFCIQFLYRRYDVGRASSHFSLYRAF